MKIKFNWGTGIVLALIVMVSGMLVLVSIAVRQDFDLVDKDYYQKSITYQQHIEKVGNTAELEKKIAFELSADTLKLTFPNLGNYENIAGKIHFYSPVEARRDFSLEVKVDTGFSQIIDLKKLEKGRYQVKIDWKAGEVEYYQEEEIAVER
ncbi:MAG TPA: nitrogen fixation protein FixH [Prolixibacteraceae bacterium]|nr:nitrogen fixation protein FixH [Prolixibacteraceae bacterium]